MLHLAALLLMTSNASVHGRLPREGAHDLEFRVTWSKSRDYALPIIIFSHGFRGSMDAYDPLVQHWAQNGFAVIQPNHADSLQYIPANLRREALQVGPRSFANWSERPREVSMIIDRLPEIEQQIPAIKGKLDKSRIGVAGHSFGAHTSQLIAGARTRLGQSFKDKRVCAAVLISPQGRGTSFADDSWKDVTGPLLVITGSKDESITKVTPKERKEPFYLSPPGGKYLMWIEGAHHGFGGITGRSFPTSGPPSPAQVAAVQQMTTDFLLSYVTHAKNMIGREFEGVKATVNVR